MSLEKLKDETARKAFGMTKAEAMEKGICIECRNPATENRFYSEAGRKEYQISGMCEICFDACFGPGSEGVEVLSEY